MKNVSKVVSLLLVVCIAAAVFAACGETEGTNPSAGTTHVDYVAETKLDMNSNTKKQEVTFGQRSQIDGDTSHFEVPKSVDASGVIKARYLAVDTPESTGQIEEWGKAASRFTQEKLSSAASIVLESDSESWNYDGNGRYLVWVWYQPAADAEYRCLNIELLQNGLGASSKASDGRYGQAAVAAINQATQEKLFMFSGQKDPEYPYGGAASITLRELRLNVEEYNGKKVSVEGIVTYNSDYTAFIQSYDGETGMWYGVQVFYGYNSQLIPVLEQGSKVRVVGVLTEFYGTYQISSLNYNPMKPEDPTNTVQLSKGNEVTYPEATPEVYAGNVTVPSGDSEVTKKFKELAVSTTLSMKNLKVTDVYTTTNPDSHDCGAMTLTCEVDGKTVSIRTGVFYDDNGNIFQESVYAGKTIDINGILEAYNGDYQIRALAKEDITIHN
ncbi:MAG: hypothetical protein E7462_00250 [Ruminococcaceae bacterium]|nr:hypothetical protein [Oscillospiraceae bacterium]